MQKNTARKVAHPCFGLPKLWKEPDPYVDAKMMQIASIYITDFLRVTPLAVVARNYHPGSGLQNGESSHPIHPIHLIQHRRVHRGCTIHDVLYIIHGIHGVSPELCVTITATQPKTTLPTPSNACLEDQSDKFHTVCW